MTTLKQLIFEVIRNQNYPITDEVGLHEDIIKAIEEWLKQKQKSSLEDMYCGHSYNSCINELLEDLEK